MSLFLSNVFLAKLAPKISAKHPQNQLLFQQICLWKSREIWRFLPRPIRSPATWVKEKWAISPVSFQNCFSVPWLRYSAVWPNVIKYFLFSLWTAWFTMLIKKAKVLFLLNLYAPINVNPVGGGVWARGGDLTNFEIFGSNFPGWETKGRSKVSKKPLPQEKKSKQTIL